ncbi:4Fe-4S dicluster domain-containing protein [Noviherbaspirillum cavernae]|uniref:4Fe-4S dicluster domain-containing protein n=1 Tax=Noviherbaspirillum cavernae TaxID=2320862 RepID=A0A418X4Q5_9BURK|nr:4Fe-4S binding protein [Noviherbaspirillum cavernae]RJG07454.1 4Fe-4S dicluster domain-containing protein [Noviherbaspirillum cavernae]
MSTQFKVCNCNHTMPLDAASGTALGKALDAGPLNVVTQLCRREVGAYLDAVEGVDQVVVACTQERALFSELAAQKQTVAPIRFVNIRETGGWSAEAKTATPKMAALLAAAALPDPEPVPTVEYDSGGQVLVIGPASRALPWAERLGAQLEVSVLLTSGGGEGVQDRLLPAFSGAQIRIDGWLGAFKASWQQANPIDLEVCTRCNACIEVCPENAIDLTYQIDLDKCTSHRDCVKACGAIGAIDFARDDTMRKGEFDLIFDLCDAPLITLHQPPQGYFAPGANEAKQTGDALQLLQMVGQFSKPKFFAYKEKICAHSRNEQTGCNACIEVCSAAAITGDGNHIKVNPNLCVGCGACTTVCPSGALTYAWPRPSDLGLRIKTLLTTYAKASGAQPALLLHSQEHGADLIGKLGRMAQTGGRLKGVPARVIPVELHHTASVGIDVWLAAVSFGATNIAILTTDEEAPQYVTALRSQIGIAQTILTALGYQGSHVQLLRVDTPQDLDNALHALQPGEVPAQRATFHVTQEKRTTLEFAIEHLLKFAPQKKDEIPLPAGAPYGMVHVDTAACTLCMSCVGACPESALTDNPNLPQLRFIEKNCVQCGLCEKTCPENAITLTPRLLLTERARQAVVLNEAQPWHCIRCHKPFGTLQMIENMVGKLSAHGAFAGNIDRLKMCPDCRVIDMMENKRETSILDLKR